MLLRAQQTIHMTAPAFQEIGILYHIISLLKKEQLDVNVYQIKWIFSVQPVNRMYMVTSMVPKYA